MLVLHLYSSVTVGKILLVEGQQDKNHPGRPMFGPIIYAIPPGCCQFQGKSSIQGVCDYVMVFLNIFLCIYGFHITTKINWLSECVSLYFLIMQSDIVEPHLLTSKHYEHKNSMIRGM